MVKLKKIILKNCQSWSYGEFNLCDGLNVISADNDVGKSVIFKILKAMVSPSYYYRPDELSTLIREGAEYAECKYLFSDDSLCIMRILKKKILYAYTDDYKSKEFIRTLNSPPNQVLDKLGIIRDDKSGFVVNIADSDGELLLVQSNASTNTSLLRILAEDENIEKIKTVTAEQLPLIKQLKRNLKLRLSNIQYLKSTISYKDTRNMKRAYKDNMLYYNGMKSINNIKNKLLNIKQVSNIDYSKYIKYSNLCSTLSTVNNLRNTEDKDYNSVVRYLDLYITLNKIKNIKQQDYTDYNSYINLLSVSSCIYRTINILDENRKAIKHISKLSKAKSLNNLMLNINALKITNSFDTDKYYKYIELAQKLEVIVTNIQKYKNNLKYINNVDSEIIEFNKDLDSVGSSHDCPIYGKIVFTDNKCIPKI